jgi:hypothetical protein
MARARRSKSALVDEGEGKPIAKSLPEVCPLCSSADEGMLTHLQSHAPVALCQHCDGKEKGWRLDTDGALYFRTDVSLFYCSNCGRYAPVPMREEVTQVDEA